eukprot:COSAG04_NODE_27591_length_281_cov_1.137363_1_plen_33_part_10
MHHGRQFATFTIRSIAQQNDSHAGSYGDWGYAI